MERLKRIGRCAVAVVLLILAAVTAQGQDAPTNRTVYATIEYVLSGSACFSTNAASASRPSDTIEHMIEHGTLTNVVRQLVEGGHICTVYGHQWRGGRPGEVGGIAFLDYHPGVAYRTCGLCRKCESRSTDWQ